MVGVEFGDCNHGPHADTGDQQTSDRSLRHCKILDEQLATKGADGTVRNLSLASNQATLTTIGMSLGESELSKMIVSHRHKFIFLKTRKTGGTSVELALRSLCGDEDIVTQVSEDRMEPLSHPPRNYLFPRSEWPVSIRLRWLLGWRPSARYRDTKDIGFFGHTTAEQARGRLGEQVWGSYFKFTIERNPWDREVSYYYWQFRHTSQKPSFQNFVRREKPMDNWSIYSLEDKPAVDHIVRYDSLQVGLSNALSQIGLEAPLLPRAKAKFRPTGHYRRFYDDETREVVRQRYKKEVELFGWLF